MILMDWPELILFALTITALACYLILRLCWHYESRELDWRYEDTMRRAADTLDRVDDRKAT